LLEAWGEESADHSQSSIRSSSLSPPAA
jgi:hypothetical protein